MEKVEVQNFLGITLEISAEISEKHSEQYGSPVFDLRIVGFHDGNLWTKKRRMLVVSQDVAVNVGKYMQKHLSVGEKEVKEVVSFLESVINK